MRVRLMSSGSEEASTQELTGLQFYKHRKREEAEKTFFFLSRCHASIISSFCRLSRGALLSLHGQATSINYCFLCVQRACPNLLSSLNWMRVSCHHCCIVLGHVLCFCCMVLLLSKPAWFHGYVNLFSWVIINLQGPPMFFFTCSPLVGLTI